MISTVPFQTPAKKEHGNSMQDSHNSSLSPLYFGSFNNNKIVCISKHLLRA